MSIVQMLKQKRVDNIRSTEVLKSNITLQQWWSDAGDRKMEHGMWRPQTSFAKPYILCFRKSMRLRIPAHTIFTLPLCNSYCVLLLRTYVYWYKQAPDKEYIFPPLKLRAEWSTVLCVLKFHSIMTECGPRSSEWNHLQNRHEESITAAR